jgi:hypothetical protein
MLWLACSALVAIAGFFVLMPLFEKRKGNVEIGLPTETEFDRLLNRKTMVYGNLKDLEFEYAMGRLTNADYQQLSAAYKNEAAAILQKLDQVDAAGNADETIEEDIALRKSRLYGSSSEETLKVSSCPACGAEVLSGKRFCGDCGHRF